MMRCSRPQPRKTTIAAALALIFPFAAAAAPSDADRAAAETCNRLASFAGYPDSTVQGTPLAVSSPPEELTEAERACRQAKKAFANEKRYKYQYARVVFAKTRGAEGMPELREAAEAGIAGPQFILADLYTTDGIPETGVYDTSSGRVSRADAERYMRAAAESGHAAAVVRFVGWLADGRVVRRDPKEAKALLARATAGTQNPEAKGQLTYTFARFLLSDPDSKAADFVEAQRLLASLDQKRWGGLNETLQVRAMRLGLGRDKDVDGARALMKKLKVENNYSNKLEELELAILDLPKPEARAEIHRLLEADTFKYGDFAKRSADLMLKGEVVGRSRLRGLKDLSNLASDSIEAAIQFAGEIRPHYEYQVSAAAPKRIMARLLEGADLGVPGAVKALIELKKAANEQFRDDVGAIHLTYQWAARGDSDAKLMLLEEDAVRKGEDPNQAKRIIAEIDALAASGNAAAHRVKATLLAKGFAYRQDVAGAAAEYKLGAEGGDVAAMVLLADAYSSGDGVEDDPAKEAEWLLKAAATGNIEAKRALIWAKKFAWSGGTIPTRDGVGEAIALYADGLSFNIEPFSPGAFSRPLGGPEGPEDAPRAVMNGFAMSTTARADDRIVRIFKSMPKDFILSVEAILADEGFLKSEPDGFMGPDARTALAAWAEAHEPDGVPTALASVEQPSDDGAVTVPERPDLPEILAYDILNNANKSAHNEAAAAKGGKQLRAAIKKLYALARYGVLPARWTLVDNYLNVTLVRAVVSEASIVSYAIDTMISADAEPNAQQKFADITHALAGPKQRGDLADGLLNTVRDDPRLRDPSVLLSVLNLMKTYDDVCPALAKAARSLKIQAVTDAGCDEASRDAFIAWATEKGPTAGLEKDQRAAAAEILAWE